MAALAVAVAGRATRQALKLAVLAACTALVVVASQTALGRLALVPKARFGL